jgi:hypothetical protein
VTGPGYRGYRPVDTAVSNAKDLVKTELFLLVADPVDLGGATEAILAEEIDIAIRTTTSVGGLDVIPAFTSEQKLTSWAEEGDPWVALGGDHVFRFVVQNGLDGVVVDPGDMEPVVIRREECEAFLRTEPR